MPFININKSFIDINKSFIYIYKSFININKCSFCPLWPFIHLPISPLTLSPPPSKPWLPLFVTLFKLFLIAIFSMELLPNGISLYFLPICRHLITCLFTRYFPLPPLIPNPGGGGGGGGTQVQRGALRISRKKGSYFKTSACPRFCKRRVLYCTQVRSMEVKIPLQYTKYTRL